MPIIATIRDRLPRCCTTNRCQRGKQSITFRPVFQEQLLVDLDRINPPITGQHCDYLFWGNCSQCSKLWLVAVEFKRGALVARNVVRQLQGGAQYASKYMNPNDGFDLFPVLIFGGECPDAALTILKNSRIILFGRKYLIRWQRHRFTFPARSKSN